MNIDRCLERIAYDGSLENNIETLKALKLAFLYSVPFENLDIHLGREITLSLDKIYRKLVEEERGGFCYECNMLFYAMLEQLGFKVSYLAATMLTAIAMGRDFDHMALAVNLDQEYLVDVGNGQSCRQPLRIDGEDGEVNYENIAYKVTATDTGYEMRYKTGDEAWKPRFAFAKIPRKVEEFAEMCQIQQVAPECHFTRHRVATIATGDGRVTLMDNTLSITDQGGLHKIEIQSESQYLDILREYFGIRLQSIPGNWL